MRWAQIKDHKGSRAVCLHEETIYEFPAKLGPLLNFYGRYRMNFGDPKNAVAILKENGATTLGTGTDTWDNLPFIKPIDRPGKIICAGLNYRDHAEEMSLDIPEHPTFFAKFDNALIGPTDEIRMPAESTKIDWEAELALVIGQRTHRVSEDEALDSLLGYTVFNDVSVRDWQGRTSEWFQGKNWDRMTPFGPVIVTPDEIDPVAGLDMSCTVDGVVRQSSNTSQMIFTPAQLISYLSQFMTLEAGDIIATGTPAGVGLSLHPRAWLTPGQEVVTRIEGIGELRNRCSDIQ